MPTIRRIHFSASGGEYYTKGQIIDLSDGSGLWEVYAVINRRGGMREAVLHDIFTPSADQRSKAEYFHPTKGWERCPEDPVTPGRSEEN